MVTRSGVLLGVMCAVANSGCAYMVVGAGHVGVRWTPDGVDDHVYAEGMYRVSPFDTPTVYDARSQGSDEKLEVLALNGERIQLDASLRYHIIPAEAVALDKELGPDFYSVLLGPTLRSQARRVVGRYEPEEIYSTRREVIEREIREGIEKVLEGRHVALEAVLIRDVTLPLEVQRAINEKLEAEQSSLKEKFVIEKAKQEITRKQLETEADAARAKTRALGDAEAQHIAAQATADANKVLEEHITDKVLKWRQVQAIDKLADSPNAKVILLPEGKTVPFLQVQ
jgi:regulator of protease activity HflC (stomatin/prohibitin superfamily)